jgi:cytoskeleton protein RodZ
MAGQMRISLRQLVAIEADRYEELPGPVFVRGFIKNYARLLNLDPAPLLRSLESALSADMPLREQHYEGAMPDSRSGRTRLWFAIFLVLLAGVLGAAAYE